MPLVQLGINQLKHRPGGGATTLQAPVITPGQVIDFGAKSRTSAGDYQIANTGGISTSRTINSGNTGTHWDVSVAGVLTPTAAGQTAVLASTPYTLNITLTNAAGSSTADVTVRTSGDDANGNDLAVSWSVSSATELDAAAEHASLAFGDNILLRSGAYNSAQLDVRIIRAGAPVGTWIPPSLIDAAHPDKGSDLDTGNFIKITKHAGASPVIHLISVYGNIYNAAYLRFTGLDFYRPPLGVVTQATSPCLLVVSGAGHVAIDNCHFSSQLDDGQMYEFQAYSAATVSTGSFRCWIKDNVAESVAAGFQINGDDTEVVGNEVRNYCTDAIFISPSPVNATRFLCAWNKVHSVHQLNPAIGAHADSMQIADATVLNSGLRIIGNRIWVGTGYASGAQGIFGSANSVGAVVAGNIVTIETYHILSLNLLDSSFIYNNTFIGDADGTLAGWARFNTSTNSEMKHNIGSQFIDQSPTGPNTLSDNSTITRAQYSTYFVNPQSGSAVTDPAVNYAIRTDNANAADTATIKRGAHQDYIDYDARETYFPWEGAVSYVGTYRVQAGVVYVGG